MAAGVALLVLDMQNDIAGFHGKNDEFNRFVNRIRRVIDWAHASEIPVIHSRVAYRPSYIDNMPRMAMIKERRLLDETQRGSAVIDELAPEGNDIVVVRRRVSAFYNTDLEVVLRGLKTHTLLFTGMSTARVVESTVRCASDRDYRAVVISDACSADTPEKHENALKSMADFFGEVMTTDAVIKAFSQESR